MAYSEQKTYVKTCLEHIDEATRLLQHLRTLVERTLVEHGRVDTMAREGCSAGARANVDRVLSTLRKDGETTHAAFMDRANEVSLAFSGVWTHVLPLMVPLITAEEVAQR